MSNQLLVVGGISPTVSMGGFLNTSKVATHSYGTGHADWTLTNPEMECGLLSLTGTADAPVNAIATPTNGKLFIVKNACGQAATIKATGQTGVTVDSASFGLVLGNGTDFVSIGIQTITSGLTVNANSRVSHDYAAAHADWTLSAGEMLAGHLTLIGTADAGVNAIATPTIGKFYVVRNTCGQAATIKATGQTGVVVANNKTAIIMGNGTDFVRVTADA